MYGVEGDGGSVGGVDEESGGGHVDGQADGGGEQDGDAGFDDGLRGECGFGYAAMQCGGDFEPSAAYEQYPMVRAMSAPQAGRMRVERCR